MAFLYCIFTLLYFQYGANSGHGLEGDLGGDVKLPVAPMYSASSHFAVSLYPGMLLSLSVV